MATLSGFFGVLALLLAALGLSGVMSYTVTRRHRSGPGRSINALLYNLPARRTARIDPMVALRAE